MFKLLFTRQLLPQDVITSIICSSALHADNSLLQLRPENNRDCYGLILNCAYGTYLIEEKVKNYNSDITLIETAKQLDELFTKSQIAFDLDVHRKLSNYYRECIASVKNQRRPTEILADLEIATTDLRRDVHDRYLVLVEKHMIKYRKHFYKNYFSIARFHK